MIIICYGMQRSGSTLFFELVQLLLERAGNTVSATFMDQPTVAKLSDLVPTDNQTYVCVKTHSPANAEVTRYIAENAPEFPAIFVSFRDPCAVGLSLLDAGHDARTRLSEGRSRWVLALHRLTHRNPYGAAFANLIDHDDALDVVSAAIDNASTWLSLPRSTAVSYDNLTAGRVETAFHICELLGVSPSSMDGLAEELAERPTQQNYRSPDRYRTVMSEEMQAVYRRRLGPKFQAVFGQDMA